MQLTCEVISHCYEATKLVGLAFCSDEAMPLILFSLIHFAFSSIISNMLLDFLVVNWLRPNKVFRNAP